MDLLGLVHTALAAVALLTGPAVFFHPKGDRYHRRVGYVYVVSMAAMNGTALMTFDLFGGWGPFHWLALMSLATLLIGFVPAWLKRPAGSWMEWHYMGMCWSYVGLAAAGAAEVFTRVPHFWPSVASLVPAHYFWIATGVSMAVATVVGVYLIRFKKLGFPTTQAK